MVWLLHLNKGFPVLGYYYDFVYDNCPHLATALSLTTAWEPASSQLCYVPWSPDCWVSENSWVSTETRKLELKSRVAVQGGQAPQTKSRLMAARQLQPCTTCQQDSGLAYQRQRGSAGKLRSHSRAPEVTHTLGTLLGEKNLCVTERTNRKTIRVLTL